MKILKIKTASFFLAILILFTPYQLSYARNFSLKRLLFPTFGIYFKDDYKIRGHKDKIREYKRKLQKQENKLWPRKIYILGVKDSSLKKKIKLHFELDKLEKENKRLRLSDLRKLEQIIEESNKFDYVDVDFNYAPSCEEQIIIYIKMPQAFHQVTIINNAANKLSHKLLEKAVQPLITSCFDNTSLSKFAKVIKKFYKYLGYDYFFIRSFIIDDNKLTIDMDESRINQFSVIGTIYFCDDDDLITQNLDSKIPLIFASNRFRFRKNGSFNTNYADRAIESLKSDLIVDVCRYEIDYVQGYKVPLDISLFMTSLPQRSGFLSIYPEILSDLLINISQNGLNYSFNLKKNNWNIHEVDLPYTCNNNFFQSYDLTNYYSYFNTDNYLQLLKTNILLDHYFKVSIDRLMHIGLGYYDLRNLIRKTDHLYLEIDWFNISENFKVIYKDLWTNIADNNLGILKFSFLSSKEIKDSSYFTGLKNFINRSFGKNNNKSDMYLLRQNLGKIEMQHNLFDFLSIYNRIAVLNKKHIFFNFTNPDSVIYNYQLLTRKKVDTFWTPKIKKFLQTIRLCNWAFIYHTIQDINALYNGTALYVEFVNIYTDRNRIGPINKLSIPTCNLIKFKEVLFIPFSIDGELNNDWSGLFNLTFYYISQNSKNQIPRSTIFSYANMISDNQSQNNFPGNSLTCEIHKRIKTNISTFSGFSLEKSYLNTSFRVLNLSKLNFSILIGFTINIPIQDVQPLYIYYGFPIFGKTSNIGFKMSLYRSVQRNLNTQI
uniref:Uncharacterized protein n=1 Tax=Porphyridium purpureum TaxID=35688 RepID=W0S1N8_PORPP|nr:hypothetical protein Y721_p190 [Porphyridium purpureum]BAO23618.1 hypothetical protein [Porphyridium purpureum]